MSAEAIRFYLEAQGRACDRQAGGRIVCDKPVSKKTQSKAIFEYDPKDEALYVVKGAIEGQLDSGERRACRLKQPEGMDLLKGKLHSELICDRRTNGGEANASSTKFQLARNKDCDEVELTASFEGLKVGPLSATRHCQLKTKEQPDGSHVFACPSLLTTLPQATQPPDCPEAGLVLKNPQTKTLLQLPLTSHQSKVTTISVGLSSKTNTFLKSFNTIFQNNADN